MYDSRPQKSSRLSTKELLGVIVLFAIGAGGGYWYLSQQQTVAAGATTEAEDAADVRSGSQGPGGRTEQAAAALAAESQQLALLERRIAELEGELDERAGLAAAAASGNISTKTADAVQPGANRAVMGRRTLEYWNQMNGVIAQEAEMRKPPTQLTAVNAAAFVDARATASRFAADEISRLDTSNVDPEVLSLAKSIVAWYEQGAALNETAGGLLGADTQTRRGAAGNQWKSGEHSHREKVDQINRRGIIVRGKMKHKYKLDFPPLL